MLSKGNSGFFKKKDFFLQPHQKSADKGLLKRRNQAMILKTKKNIKNSVHQPRTFSSRNQDICFYFQDIPDMSDLDFEHSWNLKRLLEWERTRIWTARRNIENMSIDLSRYLFGGIENGIQFGEMTDVLLFIERSWAVLLYDRVWGNMIRKAGIDEKVLERGSLLCQRVIEETIKERNKMTSSSIYW